MVDFLGDELKEREKQQEEQKTKHKAQELLIPKYGQVKDVLDTSWMVNESTLFEWAVRDFMSLKKILRERAFTLPPDLKNNQIFSGNLQEVLNPKTQIRAQVPELERLQNLQDVSWNLKIGFINEAVMSFGAGWKLFENVNHIDYLFCDEGEGEFRDIFGYCRDDSDTTQFGHFAFLKNSRNFNGHYVFLSKGEGDIREFHRHFESSFKRMSFYFPDDNEEFENVSLLMSE